MQIFTNLIGWIVISQLLLGSGCIIYEMQFNAFFAIYTYSKAYSAMLCASFFFAGYYLFVIFQKSMKRDGGARIRAMYKSIMEGKK